MITIHKPKEDCRKTLKRSELVEGGGKSCGDMQDVKKTEGRVAKIDVSKEVGDIPIISDENPDA